MKNIYLDHSATTPVDKEVLAAMLPYFKENFGNASSVHAFGQSAMAGVDKAREQAASFLNCGTDEIVFTSGSTESNNLAIRGLVKAMKIKGIEKPHIVTTSIEHDAVLEPCKQLERDNAEITFISPEQNGVVDVEKVIGAIRENTVLVSVMHVNSEVGSLQPIREIGKSIKKYNEKKIRDWQKIRPKERGEKPDRVYFHTDATQAVNFFNQDTVWNYVDMLSMSAHKIYGPKGVGLLMAKNYVPLKAIQYGGHHEGNKRSGTLNVPGIVGMGKAISLIKKEKLEVENKQLEVLRNKLADGIMKKVPDVILNTDRKYSTPAHAHFTFLGIEGESILISLDLEGIAVSTGSACASASLKASHVLLAMGIKKEIAHSSIRFSLGKNNTEEDIDKVLEVLPPIIERLRKMAPENI